MDSDKLETPVLFIIFNRPATTAAVFREIRNARPSKLFIAADGPRGNRPEEFELCARTRKIVSQIDWECEVHTLFREKNLGCKKAVSSAIEWFFQHVEEGIILEDDCLPDGSFFWFCDRLLKYYRDDRRVMMIAGTNYLFNKINTGESYFFSRYFPVWGWATWRRAWKLYDIAMEDWPKYKELGFLRWLYPEKSISEYLSSGFQNTYEGKIDTWDFQWCYTCIFNNGLCATSVNNLIGNLGISGTHTSPDSASNSKFFNMPVKSLDVTNIIHPKNIVPNFTIDRLNFLAMRNRSHIKDIRSIAFALPKNAYNRLVRTNGN
jgi:hypothetical protein